MGSNNVQQTQKNGFTLVELVIVSAVIAILASIGIAAHSGIQARADTTVKVQTMSRWAKIFESYKSSKGEWPSAMAGGGYYCLGTGFPSSSFSGNVPRCRDYNSTSTGYLESDATPLMTQLRTVSSSLPDSPKIPMSSAVVGPYVYRSLSSSAISIIDVFPHSSAACPSGTTDDSNDPNRTARWCRIKLEK